MKKSILFGMIVPLACLAEAFPTDVWLDKCFEGLRQSEILQEWKNQYEVVYVEPRYDEKKAAIYVFIEISDNPLEPKTDSVITFYGANNFQKIRLENKFSIIWFTMTMSQIYHYGKRTALPDTLAKKVCFVIDSRNSTLRHGSNIYDERKKVKKTIFEYAPISGMSKERLFGLSPIKETEFISSELPF